MRQIRIAEYILQVVATRTIPGGREGAVIMKLDVEGPRLALDITSDLVMSGALAHIDQLHIDWPWPWTTLEETVERVDDGQEDVDVVLDRESLAFQ